MSRTLGQLLYAMRYGDLLLPNFQRPFVWTPDRCQSLVASILLEYPVGQALIGTKADSHTMSVRRPMSIPEKRLCSVFSHKIGIPTEVANQLESVQCLAHGESYDCEYLLDGQQRITALDLVFGSAYHFAASKNDIKRNYRIRWFLNLNKLGLKQLEWTDIREMQHEDVCEAIVCVKYKKTDKSQSFHYEKSDMDLADFCTSNPLQEQVISKNLGLIEPGIYLPLDKIYRENQDRQTLELDSDNFLIDLFDDKQQDIINQTIEGSKLKENQELSHKDKEYKENKRILKRKYTKWKQNFINKLNDVIRFEFPVYEVPSNEFNRLSGIFSVVNMGGVELSTFDLLVAKTTTAESGLREVMKKACKNSIKDFNKLSQFFPEPARTENFEFWKCGEFLSKKSAEEINLGLEFPEPIAKSFSQTLSLHEKLYQWLGENWYTRSNPLSHFQGEKQSKVQDTARLILLCGKEWSYSDKSILSLSRDTVLQVQEQAAKQLLRAYFFMKARLGVSKLSDLPYRQLDLVLSIVLTDSVWSKIQKDPTGTVIKKIQWWYWGSIFGGAYQKARSSIDKRILSDIPRLLAYVSKPSIRWQDVKNLAASEDERKNTMLTEAGIVRSDGTQGDRFECICDAEGYSSKEALMASPNKALGSAIRSFILRNGLSDFQYRESKKKNNQLKRHGQLHAGTPDLQTDHLYPLKGWQRFTGESVARNDDHPLNSPLNYSWSSAAANRYWSDHPSFRKLELQSALEGNQESIDFLHEHLLSVEAVENDYREVLLGSEDGQKKDASKILRALLEKRFEKLRYAILAENPEV